MTSSMMSDRGKKPKESVKKVEKSSRKGIALPLKVLEYMSLAAAIGLSITAFVFPGYFWLIVAVAIAVGLFVFMFLVNLQLETNYAKEAKDLNLKNKALLCNSCLSGTKQLTENSQVTPVVEKALRYSQGLIEDYKKTRGLSRNIYYVLQLGTILLSGVTPILVLVDKLETGSVWLKWLPVICPAIASIVASMVTSFPFQENWISANRVVELLEAEQEKLILGVIPAYRHYDIVDPVEREKSLRKAIANFIAKVNSIHLKQIQGDSEESKKAESSEYGAPKAPEN
ncbi:MAG: DUF4231 domain-containing protein [Hormoscilla sp.]